MKKIFLLAAAALVALTACTKIDDVTSTPDVKIGYQVATFLNQTKADEPHGHTSFISELEELGISESDASFKSVAYIHADNGAGGTFDPALFFNAATNGDGIETVKYDGSSVWAPIHTYYWPKAVRSNLDFFSWYNYTGTDAVCNYDGTNATLVWNNRTVALKDNVMWADAAWHYTSNPSAEHGLDGVTEGVPTLFHHGLAKVRFTAAVTIEKQADAANNGYFTFWEVTLSNVSIANNAVKNNGNLKLTQATKATIGTQAYSLNSSTEADNTNLIWEDAATTTYLSTLDQTTIFNTDVAKGNTVLTTSPAFMTPENTYMADNYFTVRPQAVSDAIVLTFKYTIKTYYGTEAQFAAEDHGDCKLVSQEIINVNDYGPAVANLGAPYTNTGVQLNALTTSAPAYWKMNYKITYNIIINPITQTIKYDPAVEVWETATGEQTVPRANS